MSARMVSRWTSSIEFLVAASKFESFNVSRSFKYCAFITLPTLPTKARQIGPLECLKQKKMTSKFYALDVRKEALEVYIVLRRQMST